MQLVSLGDKTVSDVCIRLVKHNGMENVISVGQPAQKLTRP